MEWIKCSEKLPKDVLCISDYKGILDFKIAHCWSNDPEPQWIDDHSYLLENVIYWMPLPDAPKYD